MSSPGSPQRFPRRSAALTAAVSVAALVGLACGPDPAPAPEHRTATIVLGSWRGTGDMTLGDVSSDTGVFRIRWTTSRESPRGAGRFKLTVHSAVSGRPLEVVVDARGEGSGVVDFSHDPRIYQFLVESAGVEWAFSVEAEVVTGPARQQSFSVLYRRGVPMG